MPPAGTSWIGLCHVSACRTTVISVNPAHLARRRDMSDPPMTGTNQFLKCSHPLAAIPAPFLRFPGSTRCDRFRKSQFAPALLDDELHQPYLAVVF